MTTADAQIPFDPTDPHGYHAQDTHGHVIVPLRALVGVLLALLFLTALTVFASRVEVWIAQAFHVEIPQSINVLIAMAIAVVKGSLVAMIFMQLVFDTRFNALILFVCLMTMSIFLGLTALDLLTRDSIDPIKSGEIIAGGDGAVASRHERVYDEATGTWVKKKVALAGTPVYLHAETRKRPPNPAVHHTEPVILLSDANRSIPMTGLLLFKPEEPHEGAHATSEHTSPEHAQGESAPQHDAPDHEESASPPEGDGGH